MLLLCVLLLLWCYINDLLIGYWLSDRLEKYVFRDIVPLANVFTLLV